MRSNRRKKWEKGLIPDTFVNLVKHRNFTYVYLYKNPLPSLESPQDQIGKSKTSSLHPKSYPLSKGVLKIEKSRLGSGLDPKD